MFRGPVILVTIFRARSLRAQNSNQHATPQWRSILIEGWRYEGLLARAACEHAGIPERQDPETLTSNNATVKKKLKR